MGGNKVQRIVSLISVFLSISLAPLVSGDKLYQLYHLIYKRTFSEIHLLFLLFLLLCPPLCQQCCLYVISICSTLHKSSCFMTGKPYQTYDIPNSRLVKDASLFDALVHDLKNSKSQNGTLKGWAAFEIDIFSSDQNMKSTTVYDTKSPTKSKTWMKVINIIVLVVCLFVCLY